MANVRIPDHLKKGFEIYFGLSADKRNNFLKSLKDIPIGLIDSGLSNYLSKSTGIDLEDSNKLAEVIFSFVDIESSFDKLSIDEIAKLFLKALKTANIKLTKSAEELLVELLEKSQNENLKITRKAFVLEYDQSNLLTDSKILTDVRPIFGFEESNDEIKHSIIINKLRLSYRKNSESKEKETLFFALDENDLKDLKFQIIRAEKKAEQIKKTYDIISIRKTEG